MDPNEQSPSMPDAPDAEKMEQIRQRRMAKLGASNPVQPQPEGGDASSSSPPKPPTPTTASPVPPEAKRTKINITPAVPASNPFSQLGAASGSTMPPAKRSAPESFEDWADKTLSQIFRFTLDESRPTDIHGRPLILLSGVRDELQQEQAQTGPFRLSADVLEQGILEAASAFPHDKPLMDYMLPCWKRVIQAKKTLRAPTPEKESLLAEAKRLCMSYCLFAVTLPDLFGREARSDHDTIVPYLLRDMDHETGLCLDFMQEAVSRFAEDDTLPEVFVKAMVDISSRLSKMNMNDDYKPYVNVGFHPRSDALLTDLANSAFKALKLYCKFPHLLDALARHPTFNMAQSAPGIEKHTILGPFFRISPLQTEVTKAYFASPRSISDTAVKNAQSALQITLATHQVDLKDIVNAFVRASIDTRNKLLDWFAYIMNVNHKRRAMQVDPKDVSSDGFMMNITVILDFLCEPFMDTTFSKIDRIDVGYFRRSPRVDIKEETKLNADQAHSDNFYSQKLDGSSNFISEVFFLTLAAHHYGSEATNAKLKVLDRNIKHYEKEIKKLEADRLKFVNIPAQLAMFDIGFKRHVEVLEKSISLKHAIEGCLFDEKMQARSLQFMRYVAVWLLRVGSQTDYRPDQQLKLPLSDDQPEAFQCLPEYALQDIIDNFMFIFRYIPNVILSAVGDEMITLCVAFLESSEYIKNPYLKSKLITLLYNGSWPIYHRKKGVFGDAMTGSKFANDYLLHAVMKFYIECESTGAHTQFYDKFNIRFEIFQIIKCVWTNDFYKEQLGKQSRNDREFFVRFVNLLLNDATYVLDEALSKFPKIHDVEKELRENQSLTQEQRQQKEEELQSLESQARSYMQLANETVAMMQLFTKALRDAFTLPEIVGRLAGMLDYNLEVLVGPKSQNLKVDNSEAKYKFNPKTLLPDVVDIFLNLGGAQTFVDAVADDGRSYKPETFDKASQIMTRKGLKAREELEAWDRFVSRVAKAKEVLVQAEEDFGEVPDEFEDPIMGIFMSDPVILPSRTIVDRSTIIQHLLSDQTDPYTRVPMKIEDVIPADDLRQQIEAWKKEKLAAARAAKNADFMDTTEG